MTAAATSSMRIAVLGGPGTFSHQATQRLLGLYPEYAGEPDYYPSVPELWQTLTDGSSDGIIVMEQTSRLGWSEANARMAPPDSGLHVAAMAPVPFGCSLLVKEGTALSDIVTIYGHDSLRQCRRWLDENAPGIPAVVHAQNSVVAAREVAGGDGTLAVVATMLTGEIAGLVPLAQGIDDGAAASWWLITREPRFDPSPGQLVVTLRGGRDDALGRLVAALAGAGFALQRVYSQATGNALYELDSVLALAGSGGLADVQAAVGTAGGAARLAGAFPARG